jgi:NADH:ubiquinone oxidoreductase subunit 2 (subunit N)
MLFFQYWVTFLSTVYIIFFYINVFYIHGTSEWFLLQCINILNVENTQASNNSLRVQLIIFILSVVFKLGVTPFHLFKIEVYKGIPFLSIFFYTTYYFIVLFVLFMYMLSDLLTSFNNQYIFLLMFLITIGSIYVGILLFDISFLKSFFAYSTIINTIGFFIGFMSNL